MSRLFNNVFIQVPVKSGELRAGILYKDTILKKRFKSCSLDDIAVIVFDVPVGKKLEVFWAVAYYPFVFMFFARLYFAIDMRLVN